MEDILTKEQAEAAIPNIPPAGYARNEELLKRTDDLAEKAQAVSDEGMVGTIDPKKLEPIREYQEVFTRPIDPLTVPNAQKEFDYCWVWTGSNGQKIWEKKSMMVSGMRSTWHVVQGEMTEALDYKTEDTTRRIGDIILMRILKDDHKILLDNIEYRRQLQEYGVVGELIELGDKYRGKGFIVHSDPNSRFASGKESVMDTVRRRAASGQGMKAVDNMVRNGNVPGIPRPGQGG